MAPNHTKRDAGQAGNELGTRNKNYGDTTDPNRRNPPKELPDEEGGDPDRRSPERAASQHRR